MPLAPPGKPVAIFERRRNKGFFRSVNSSLSNRKSPEPLLLPLLPGLHPPLPSVLTPCDFKQKPSSCSYVALSPSAEAGASGPTCVHRAQALKAGAPPSAAGASPWGSKDQHAGAGSRPSGARLLACPCHRSFRSALLDGWMRKGGACVLTEPPASVGRRTESGSNTDSGRVFIKIHAGSFAQ